MRTTFAAKSETNEEEEDTKWEERFRTFVERYLRKANDNTYAQSSDVLRTFIEEYDLLKFDSIEGESEKFFKAHDLLAKEAPEIGPGFWIRFTVHFNLFCGTVVALGGDEHFQVMRGMERKGEIGCFALTEVNAGVNSGLVVDTLCEFDREKNEFSFKSPTAGSKKNWISQGLTADYAVIVATLFMFDDEEKKVNNKGPHAFLCRIRDEKTKRLLPGIEVGDMGSKTTGNDLDNAWITFDGFRAQKSCLLNRYADIDDQNGAYIKKEGDVRQMDAIGQRLFTGRIAVARAALTFCEEVFRDTKAYSDQKTCAMRGTNKTLSFVPQLKALYEEADKRLTEINAFVVFCKKQLIKVLKVRGTPSLELQTAIAVCKIRAVEIAIELTFRLKQEVGSYALMSTARFANSDFLQCCKFAEGDSRILSQKLSRDVFSAYLRENQARSMREASICESIRRQIKKFRDDRNGEYNKIDAWDSCWKEVYDLADAVCERVMGESDFEVDDSGNDQKTNPSLYARL